MEVREVEIFTDFKLVQPLKAASPTEITLLGIIIFTRPEQRLKA